VLNKVDSLDEELRDMQKEFLEEEVGAPVMMMSGASGEGVTEVLRALRSRISRDRLRQQVKEEDKPWQP
jgi:GTP-binding protein